MSYPSEMKVALSTLAQKMPERLLEELAHEEVQMEWIEAFRHRLKRKEKDAVRLYPELFKMIGAENSTTTLILNRFGYNTFEEAELAIGRYKEAAALTDEQRFDRCMQFAVTYLMKHPEDQQGAMQRLRNASRATLVEDNNVVS